MNVPGLAWYLLSELKKEHAYFDLFMVHQEDQSATIVFGNMLAEMIMTALISEPSLVCVLELSSKSLSNNLISTLR